MNRSSPSLPPVALSLPSTESWVRWWAVGGVGATFVEAILRLGARALSAAHAAEPRHLLTFALLASSLTYVEGHRALQRRFVPAVLARTAHLNRGSPRSFKLFAPLYACALVGADRRTLLRAWGGVLSIVLAVVLVRRLPALWRATVDGAVAVALCWGLAALVSELMSRRRRRS